MAESTSLVGTFIEHSSYNRTRVYTSALFQISHHAYSLVCVILMVPYSISLAFDKGGQAWYEIHTEMEVIVLTVSENHEKANEVKDSYEVWD